MVDGIGSVGKFLTEDDNAVSPFDADHNVYWFDLDFSINAYSVPG